MERGSIPVDDVPGGFDLQSTVESGQTFDWRRVDGRTYASPGAHGGDPRYVTVDDGDVVFARQRDGVLEWRSTRDAADLVRRRFRLDDDLDAIFASFPDGPALERARRDFPGLRVVRDAFFPCLVPFICSARLSVGRIHELRTEMARTFGESVTVEGTTYHAFPTPTRLAAASEASLRELGLGFRAPYVAESAEMVAVGDVTAADCRGEYEDTHATLQRFPGVGPKIADCVALFASGHLEAVPVDTWTRRLIERHFPDCSREGYAATGDAFRDRFGRYAGYAQTYLYHATRE